MKRALLLLTVFVVACATPSPAQRERDERLRQRERDDNAAVRFVRVTNNPDAVKGCELLGGITKFEKVEKFQKDVAKAGGNVGYVVATNEDGQLMGEAYNCPSP